MSDKSLPSPFWVMVRKEISEHIKSWRFFILMGLILLTTSGSIYTILSVIRDNPAQLSANNTFLYLALFTTSINNLPPFITLIGFLGPLIGIAFGFDAVSSEKNSGTLSRIFSQPVPRDYFINSKFAGAYIVIILLIFALGFLVTGTGILYIGLLPAAEEVFRLFMFLIFTAVYIAFWLNLAIMFSILFKQPSTSALSVLAIWLFFTIFYSLLVQFGTHTFLPADGFAAQQVTIALSRLSPDFLYNELVTVLLNPSIRSLGALSFEQISDTLPSLLPVGQSILLVWQDIIAIVAATLICFGISYALFMRREIRA